MEKKYTGKSILLYTFGSVYMLGNVTFNFLLQIIQYVFVSRYAISFYEKKSMQVKVYSYITWWYVSLLGDVTSLRSVTLRHADISWSGINLVCIYIYIYMYICISWLTLSYDMLELFKKLCLESYFANDFASLINKTK